jgi:hypothetical protein
MGRLAYTKEELRILIPTLPARHQPQQAWHGRVKRSLAKLGLLLDTERLSRGMGCDISRLSLLVRGGKVGAGRYDSCYSMRCERRPAVAHATRGC